MFFSSICLLITPTEWESVTVLPLPEINCNVSKIQVICCKQRRIYSSDREILKIGCGMNYFRLSLWSKWGLCSFGILLTFQDNILVLSSRIKQSKSAWPFKTGPIGCPETLVINYHPVLHEIPKELRSKVLYFLAAGFPSISVKD
jgi:hypothetical protein